MKRRIRSVFAAAVPYQVSDNQIARDNSAYWEDKNKEMQSHPDVGKRARVTKKGDDLYLKVYPVVKVDNNIYHLDLGGATATYNRDDLFISSRSRKPVESCDEPVVQVEASEAVEDDKYWMATYTSIDGRMKKIVYKYNTSSADEAAEILEDIIPEPYTKCTFRGSCDGFTREQLLREGARMIEASEEVEDEDVIPQSEQEFTSEKTSINSQKLPAIYKMIHIPSGSVGVDYGGGKFDNGIEHMAAQDVTLVVYDPYNRTAEHNKEAIRTIRTNGGADFALCSNVLNVIKESHIREEALENIKRLAKSTGKPYLTVSEGRGDSNEGETKSGYQLNRPTAGYLDESREVFPDATRKGKLIVATPNGKPVESSRDIQADGQPVTKNQTELIKKITDKVFDVMQGPHFGFPPEDVKEYSRVEGYMKDGAFVVEVRAELSYEAMSELADELNPIVQEVDQDAYFDMDEPGIMTAYLYKDVITSARYNMYNFPEPPLDPPEPKYEPEDLEEEIEFDFDFIIEVDSTGSWEYSDEALKDFEGDGGKWYGDTYPKALQDADGMVEDFDTIIQEHIPAEAGTYRIKGTAKMVYWVEGYIPEHEEDGLDMQEAHSITFMDRQSEISNFSFEAVVETATEVRASAQRPGMHEVSREKLPHMYDAVEYSNGVVVIDRVREGDSAEYHWAKYNPESEMWSIIKGLKVVKTINNSDLEDVGEIALDLEYLNKAIQKQAFGSGRKTIHTEKLDDGYLMRKYSDGKMGINKPRPYDDAEYYYALYDSDNGQWMICKSGKVYKRIDEGDLDDLNDIVEELIMVNSGIKPKMVHN